MGAVFLITLLASLTAACESEIDKCVNAQAAVWDEKHLKAQSTRAVPSDPWLEAANKWSSVQETPAPPSGPTSLATIAAARVRCLAMSGGAR